MPLVAADVLALGPEGIRPIKRSEYGQMISLGLFEGERIELIHGMLVNRPPRHPRRASTIQQLQDWLMTQLRNRFRVRVQGPLALSDDSEPEPDIAVVALGGYRDEHPRTALLVIEISDSISQLDRIKAAIYATAGVSEHWIIDLHTRTVVIHLSPSGDRYTDVRTATAEETLRPASLGIAIAAAEILPER